MSTFYAPVVIYLVFSLIIGGSIPGVLPDSTLSAQDSKAIESFLDDQFSVNADHILNKNPTRVVLQSMIYCAIFNTVKKNLVRCSEKRNYYSPTERKFMVTCRFNEAVVFNEYKIFTHGIMIVGLNPSLSKGAVPFLITIIPCKYKYIARVIKRDKYILLSFTSGSIAR